MLTSNPVGEEQLSQSQSAAEAADESPEGMRKWSKPRLHDWGIASDGERWCIFHRDSNNNWRHEGSAKLPNRKGRMTNSQKLLLLFLPKHGRIDRSEVVQLFHSEYFGQTAQKICRSVITPAMNKLRKGIRDSLKQLRRYEEIPDPIEYDSAGGSWQLTLSIGHATIEDDRLIVTARAE